MKNYPIFKEQLDGFASVLETVKTVEKISLSEISFLKKSFLALDRYADSANQLLTRLSLFVFPKNNPFLRQGSANAKATIVATGDRGLVGNLWHRVVNSFIEGFDQKGMVIAFGERGANYLKEEGVSLSAIFGNRGSFDLAIKRLSDYILAKFVTGEFSQVTIVYPQFVSLANQEPIAVSFLPFKRLFVQRASNVPRAIPVQERLTLSADSRVAPLFEPSGLLVFNRLLTSYINAYLRRIMLETRLSELFARALAMENASKKTENLIKKLALSFRKDRRALATLQQLGSFVSRASPAVAPSGKRTTPRLRGGIYE